MTLPYTRSFNAGRQSNLLFNEDMDQLYEALRHLEDEPEGSNVTPKAKLNGALWLDKENNELKTYDKKNNRWKSVYADKFQIFDQMTSDLTPANPVKGQLWLYNEVLMYYDGSGWKPVYALEKSDSQFNISSFGDYDIVSPLNKLGSTVVDDEEIDAYIEAERKYIQGKLDYQDDSSVTGDGRTWAENNPNNAVTPVIKPLNLKGSQQYLVPNINIDRVFVDDKLDFNYSMKNKVCISYPRDYMLTKDSSGATVRKVPSLIHMNPGKLNSITKRLVRIDKTNPKIGISAVHTEFYGYRIGETGGHFLTPKNDGAVGGQNVSQDGYITFEKGQENDRGDYQVLSDGIYLSYNAAQNYDYILAVTFDFSWAKATGQLRQSKNEKGHTSYYIPTAFSPLDVFVQGYNLEEPYYESDTLNRIVTIDDDTSDMEISLLHSAKHEYGFVSYVDLEKRAVIHPYHKYKQPLIFMNGEALHPMLADVEIDEETNTLYVGGGQIGMCWSILELEADDGFCMYADSGIVGQKDSNGNPAIVYDTDDIPDKAHGVPADLVVFVDGLLIRKSDVHVEMPKSDTATNRYVSIEGLTEGQEYILLYDRDGNFYGDGNIVEATAVGSFNESLVYKDGLLLCNSTAFTEQKHTPEGLADTAANGEVKQFLNDSYYDANGHYVVVSRYMVFDSATKTWIADTNNEIEHDLTGCKNSDGTSKPGIANSYTNTVTAIAYNIETKPEDDIRLYCFSYASATDSPLTVDTVNVDNQREIQIKDKKSYIVGANALSVWVNGIRQYNITEQAGGISFLLPEPVTGAVTYVIQKPEKGETVTARRVLLDNTNVVSGSANIYTTKNVKTEEANDTTGKKTDVPLYPGRVTLYVDGIRQPNDAYTIIDNYTFCINDPSTILVGAHNNYPEMQVFDSHNEPHELSYIVNKDENQIWSEDISWADKPKKENGLVDEDLVRQIQEPITEKQLKQWQPKTQPQQIVIDPSRILVEIKYDYERTEKTFRPDPDARYEISMDYYGLPQSILDTSDEILIFLDGLFFGLKNEEGYRKDKLNGSLVLKDQDFINSIIGDPLEDFLTIHLHDARDENPNIIYEDQLKEFREKREKRLHTITLEWR